MKLISSLIFSSIVICICGCTDDISSYNLCEESIASTSCTDLIANCVALDICSRLDLFDFTSKYCKFTCKFCDDSKPNVEQTTATPCVDNNEQQCHQLLNLCHVESELIMLKIK
uniref:ShKT domain-containing protein n=1 Tax=Rhabditophanes sp. KR3021 TaxID=114890 RepID=A0AC35TPN3_9BILA